MILSVFPTSIFATAKNNVGSENQIVKGHKKGDKLVFDVLKAKNPRKYKAQAPGVTAFRTGEAATVDQKVKIDLKAVGLGENSSSFDWNLLPNGLKVTVYFTDQGGTESERQEVTLTESNSSQEVTLKVPATGGTGVLHAETTELDSNLAIRVIKTGTSTANTTVGSGDWSFGVQISEITSPVINLVVKDPYGKPATAAGDVAAKLHVDGLEGSGLDVPFTIAAGNQGFNLKNAELFDGENYDSTELNYPGTSPTLTVEGETAENKLTLGTGKNAVEYKVTKTYSIQDGGTITLTSQPKVLTPQYPNNPGPIPDGYARLIFKADQKADQANNVAAVSGTFTKGNDNDKQRVIDVKAGTAWGDAKVTAAIGAVTNPQAIDDNLKLVFEKWNPELATTLTGNAAENENKTFNAVYTAKYTKDEIIPFLPNDTEPDKGSDGKIIPNDYILVTFQAEEAKGSTPSNPIYKGTIKVGTNKEGPVVKAKVKPGTDLSKHFKTNTQTTITEPEITVTPNTNYGFTEWDPALGAAISVQQYVAKFVYDGQDIGNDGPVPEGWHKVTVKQDAESIKENTVTEKYYAVAPKNYNGDSKFTGKLTTEGAFPDLKNKEKTGYKNPKWYQAETVKQGTQGLGDPVANNKPEEVVIAKDTTFTATATKDTTTDKIVPWIPADPTKPEEDKPGNGSDNKPVPDTYITVTFESEDEAKGEIKIGDKQGKKVWAKVAPETLYKDIKEKVSVVGKAGNEVKNWTPKDKVTDAYKMVANDAYVAHFIKNGDTVGENEVLPTGWYKVKFEASTGVASLAGADQATPKVVYKAYKGSVELTKATDFPKATLETNYKDLSWKQGKTAVGDKVTVTGVTTFTATATFETTLGFDKNNVTGMVVKEQPRLNYVEGSSTEGNLDLSMLVVTLTDKKGKTQDVPFSKLGDYGITANPTNGTAMTVAGNNGKPVVLTKGTLTANTNNLSVTEPSTPGPKDADKYNPKGQDIKVNVGVTPDPEKGIVNKDDLPTGTTYTWKTTPTTSTPGVKQGTVVVKYPDNSTDEVPVNVIVNDPAKQQSDKPTINQPTEGDTTVKGTATPDSTVTVTLPDGKSIDARADSNGNWSVNTPVLVAGETIKAYATDVGKNPSDPRIVIVEAKGTPTPSYDYLTLTLDENYRSGDISHYDVYVGGLIEHYLYTPHRRGYVFEGWSYNSRHLDEVRYGERIYRSTTLYAIWSKQKAKDDEEVEPIDTREVHEHTAYMKGYPDGTVRPNGKITRAEAAALITRLLGLDANASAAKANFPDTPSGWYNKAINAAVARGIMKGYPDGSFRPNAPITRAEFTQMISTIDNKPYGVAPFADVIGHWAERAIGCEYQAGRIMGYPDQTFRPNAFITRCEAVVILNKIFERSYDAISAKDAVNAHLIKGFIDLPTSFWGYNDMVEATNSHSFKRRSQGKVQEDWTLVK